MKSLYRETLSKITASDQAKAATIARMKAKAKDTAAPKSISRKKLSLVLTAALCIVCLCISVPLAVHYLNVDPGTLTPPNIGVYSMGQTYTREDGGSVTFTDIRIENNPTVNGTAYRGIYLIITGTFGFDEYALHVNESTTSLFNEDIGEDTVLRLDTALTEQLSEADLHINAPNSGETRGEVRLAYRINAATLDFITAHNGDTHEEDDIHGDITVQLSGCYKNETELAQFIFFCEDVVLP